MFQDGPERTISSASRKVWEHPNSGFHLLSTACSPQQITCTTRARETKSNQNLSPHGGSTITWSGEPLSTAERADADLRKEEVHRPETAKPSKHNTGSIRFPPNNFKHFLTLFSKFFASFPDGACSLSVSRLYLALDEIYHPFWAAISSNPTRQRTDAIPDERKSRTGFSPSVMPCSKRLIPAPLMNGTSIDYNSQREPLGF